MECKSGGGNRPDNPPDAAIGWQQQKNKKKKKKKPSMIDGPGPNVGSKKWSAQSRLFPKQTVRDLERAEALARAQKRSREEEKKLNGASGQTSADF